MLGSVRNALDAFGKMIDGDTIDASSSKKILSFLDSLEISQGTGEAKEHARAGAPYLLGHC